MVLLHICRQGNGQFCTDTIASDSKYLLVFKSHGDDVVIHLEKTVKRHLFLVEEIVDERLDAEDGEMLFETAYHRFVVRIVVNKAIKEDDDWFVSITTLAPEIYFFVNLFFKVSNGDGILNVEGSEIKVFGSCCLRNKEAILASVIP